MLCELGGWKTPLTILQYYRQADEDQLGEALEDRRRAGSRPILADLNCAHRNPKSRKFNGRCSIRVCDLLLVRSAGGPTFHGENSTKFNLDCTICRSRPRDAHRSHGTQVAGKRQRMAGIRSFAAGVSTGVRIAVRALLRPERRSPRCTSGDNPAPVVPLVAVALRQLTQLGGLRPRCLRTPAVWAGEKGGLAIAGPRRTRGGWPHGGDGSASGGTRETGTSPPAREA